MMHVLGWVLMGSGVVLFCTASGYVLVVTARRLARFVRGWRYDWRSARHLLLEVERGPERDFYGSMDLNEERGWRAGQPVPLPRIPYWPASPVPCEDLQSDARIELAHDWREQTAADLAPEALEPPCDHEYTPNLAGTHEWCQKCDSVRVIEDPGPGGAFSLGVSVPPGPVGRLCGPEQPQERERSPGNENRDRGTELGPRAALVLARWEERRAERWSLVWDNEAAA